MTKPVIYTSEWLRTTQKTAGVAKAIFAALDEQKVEHRELVNTNDYWCRDYMPVKLFDDGTYAKYEYRPDYLYDDKKERKFITKQKDACSELQLFTPTDMNIVFDGGNYVRCGNKVIMTDKILMENPNRPLDELFQHLRHSLCADIILLPWDMDDKCGHADGMVAAINDERILLNSCWKHDFPEFYKRLLKLLDPHFDVVELSYDCKPDKDSWCYLNYLQVPGAILLPCLSEHADSANDRAAIKTFKQIFPHLEIIPIYAQPLIVDGGAIHCVTWEYIEHKGQSLPSNERLKKRKEMVDTRNELE